MEIEEKVNKLYENDKTVAQIAKELRIPLVEVRSYLRKREKPRNPAKEQREQIKREMIEKIKKLYQEEGKQQVEIAKELQISISTVHKYIQILRDNGEISKGRREIMQERREKVKRLYYIEEKTVTEMAKILQVSRDTIYIDIRILNIGQTGQIQEENQKEIQENVYMNECREKIKNKTLEKRELEFIKRISETTRSYGYMITYIRACILFSQMQEAKNELEFCIENEEFTRRTKKRV